MEISTLEQLRDLSSLSRAIFQADVPEATIRELPAQTLYQVMRYNGLESSVDLIEAASAEQLRLLLDFDLWGPDGFNEEDLWNWLELTSDEDELVVLQKIIGSLDLKIVSLLINNYLEIQSFDQSTDMSPGPLFFTPDKGFTWIRVLCEDQRKHFLMSKMLAFLFESNADVFYQLLATKTITTASVLEEEALLDKTKRLSAEGFPDPALAGEVTSFLSVQDALKLLDDASELPAKPDLIVVEALVKLSDSLEPITSALAEQSNIEELLSEMTFVANSALVRFRVTMSDNNAILFMANQTQGACNIGLELLATRSGLSASEVLSKLGLQIPFRVGLSQILDLAKAASSYRRKLLGLGSELDQNTESMLTLIAAPFPSIPASLSRQKNDYVVEMKNSAPDSESLSARPEPFRYLEEIVNLKKKFTES